MDTPAPPVEPHPLTEEIRHSAALLGGALGTMGLLAALLLLVSTHLGG